VQESSATWRVPYQFTSKEMDSETGLYYFGARYYDPRTSVWQSADPILGKYLPSGDSEGDSNLPGMGGVYNPFNLAMYTYGHQNPVKYSDPDGNAVWKVPFTDTFVYAGKGGVSTTTTQDLAKQHPKLSQLTPNAKEAVQRVLVELNGRGHDVRIVEALRTKEQQEAKVKAGVSKTMASKHLDQSGLGSNAVDIVSKKYGYSDRPTRGVSKEKAGDAQSFFKELGEVVKGEGMTWGGDFFGKRLHGKPDPATGYGWDPGHAEMKPAPKNNVE
jgi:RHS repeat-associated protein